MKKIDCSVCGSKASVVRGNYRLSESGLSNVVVHGIELVTCPRCRNIDPIIPRMNDLMLLLALAVVSQPYRLKGEHVRYLRKYLSMSGVEFSRLIHVDKSTLSKWENNGDVVGEQSDRLIRAVTLALGEGMKGKMEQVVRSFPEIQESRNVRIEIDPQAKSYHYAAA